jgi:alkylhydroperoxidase family enzyme
VHDTLCGDLQLNTDSKIHVFLDFARKLTLGPETITCDDSALLQSAGLNRAAIIDGIIIVAGFNFINRLADALHFETPCPSDSLLSALFLRWFGYRALAGLRQLFSILRNNPWIEIADWNDARRPARDLAAAIDSIVKWFEFLTSLGWRAHYIAPEATRRVENMVAYGPAAVSEHEVAELKRYGCIDDDIFDLILSSAAAAGLLRLKAGLEALHQSSGSPSSSLLTVQH